MITVNVRHDKFQQAAAKLIALGGPAELRLQARLLVEEVIGWTPPFKRGAAGKQSRGEQSKKIGERAVAIEFRNAVEPVFPGFWTNPRVREALERARSQNKPDIVTKVFQNITVKGGRGVQWKEAKSVHIAHGMARRGKRRKVLSKHPYFTWNTGEWLRYRDVLKNRVGRLRASWVKAGLALGAKIPKYILRHGPINGDVKDRSMDLTRPSVAITSYGSGITDGELLIGFGKALNGRMKAMAGRYKHLIKQAKKAGGFK